MEFSQLSGVAEECSSSESGWTMYLASPVHDDDDDNSDDDDNNNKKHCDEDDYDTDDSMASDASSGPRHHEHPCGNGEGGHGMAHFQHDNKYSSCKKNFIQGEKKRNDRRIKTEKEDSVLKTNRAATPVPSAARAKQEHCPSLCLMVPGFQSKT